ncbi:MAG: His/Gly/Thr/Pro-type tRNA ligase C-terminal domain-containing protein, partial [Streptococcus salivarius]|nr:His/Gly/Thr/Pro-type tRNA ligase C-terminal domain-containing protein [Streptococcus salivarius]
VLFDDRNLAAGAQFADADLLGVPIRVIVSKRNLAENKIEVKVRSEKDYHKVDLNDVMGFIENFWDM